MNDDVKRIPYGFSDFRQLRHDFSQAEADLNSLYQRVDTYMEIILDIFVHKYAVYHHTQDTRLGAWPSVGALRGDSVGCVRNFTRSKDN